MKKRIRMLSAAAALLFVLLSASVFAEEDPGMPEKITFVPDVYEITAGEVCRPSVYLQTADPDAFDEEYGRIGLSVILHEDVAEITGEYTGSAGTGVYSGGVRGLRPGITVVSAFVPGHEEGVSHACTLIVHSVSVVTVPENVTVISAETFLGTGAGEVYLPDGVTAIGSKAFAGCTGLRLIHIPRSVTVIAEDAFDGCDSLNIICAAGSAAQTFANAHGILNYAYQTNK
ncbi:MAG: hypothetical protein CW338_04475 [Clostridiales bacterium]|nr:hypothetical protein [Clostridiales bacterium]